MEEIAVYQDSNIPSEVRIAEIALSELLSGYGRLLWALIHDRLGPEDDEAGGSLRFDKEELYSQLTLRIWKYAVSFEPQGTNPDEVRKQFVGWAATMLRNIVNDIYNEIKVERDQLAYLEEVWGGFHTQVSEENERIAMVKEILSEMTEDDVEVLRWSAPLIPLDDTTMKPDAAERDAICVQLGVTQEGLRQRRSRAFKKLKSEIEKRINF